MGKNKTKKVAKAMAEVVKAAEAAVETSQVPVENDTNLPVQEPVTETPVENTVVDEMALPATGETVPTEGETVPTPEPPTTDAKEKTSVDKKKAPKKEKDAPKVPKPPGVLEVLYGVILRRYYDTGNFPSLKETEELEEANGMSKGTISIAHGDTKRFVKVLGTAGYKLAPVVLQ